MRATRLKFSVDFYVDVDVVVGILANDNVL